MSSVEFYFIIFFPFVFSFLFILLPKSIMQNYKYLGIIGTLSFVILWTMAFHEFFINKREFYLLIESSFWNLISFDFLVKKINIPYLLFNFILVFFNYFWFWKTRIVHERFYNYLIFLLIFGSNAALLSNNLFSFLCFSEITFLFLMLMLKTYGYRFENKDILKIIMYNVASFLMVACPLLYLCFKGELLLGEYSSQLEYLKIVLPEIKAQNSSILYVLMFSMSFGVLIKCSLFPFHNWSFSAFLKSRKELILPLFGIFINLGFYSLDKFIIPLTEGLSPLFGTTLLIIFSVGICYNCIQLIQENEKKIVQFIIRLFFIHLNFCAIAFFLRQDNSKMSLLISLYFNFFTFFTLISFISKKTTMVSLQLFFDKNIYMKEKIKNFLFLFFLLSYVGLPFLGFFNSEFVILLDLFKQNGIIGIIISFLMVIPMVKILRELSSLSPENNNGQRIQLEMLNLKVVPVIILFGLNLIMGINPNIVFNFLKNILL